MGKTRYNNKRSEIVKRREIEEAEARKKAQENLEDIKKKPVKVLGRFGQIKRKLGWNGEK